MCAFILKKKRLSDEQREGADNFDRYSGYNYLLVCLLFVTYSIHEESADLHCLRVPSFQLIVVVHRIFSLISVIIL